MLYCILMMDKRTDSSYNHSHKKNAKSLAKALDIKQRIGQNSQPRSLNCEIPFIEKMTGLTKEEVKSIS